MDFSEKLPPEIFLNIISYLEGDEIFPCLGVCHRWREVLDCGVIWKPLCQKARIFDPVLSTRELLPLCSWAEAYYRFRCVPLNNWRIGEYKHVSILREEADHYCDAWDGHYAAIYYYTFGKINLYSIYEEINLKQVIPVSLPKTEVFNNASISINEPYIVAARFNVAIIYKRNKIYAPIKTISVRENFEFGFNLSKRNTKLGAEIAWGCLWMKAEPIKDTFIVDLKDFSNKYISGKPHLAFNDNVKLVIAWSKSSIRVTSLKGDVLLSLERNKIKSVDYNYKVLVVKVENNLEIIDIKTGITLLVINTHEKIEFGLGSTLILLEGNKTSSISSVSLQSGSKIWSVCGLKGKACDLRFVGSKYLFVVPSFQKDFYCLIDSKGNYIRESPLPDVFDQFPSPVFNETLPFLVVTNEETFDIVSFI